MSFIVMICSGLPLTAAFSGVAIQSAIQVYGSRAELRADNRRPSESKKEFCERNELTTCILSNIYVGATSIVEGASKEVSGFAENAVKTVTGEFYKEGRPFRSIICYLSYAVVILFIGVIWCKIRNAWINLKNGSRWDINIQTIDDFCTTALESKISKREKFNIWFCLLLLNISAEQWLRKRGVKSELLRPTLKLITSLWRQLVRNIDDIGGELKEVFIEGISGGWKNRSLDFIEMRSGRVLGRGVIDSLGILGEFSNDHQSVCAGLSKLCAEIHIDENDGLAGVVFKALVGIWHINYISLRTNILKRLKKYLERMNDYAVSMGEEKALSEVLLVSQKLDEIRGKLCNGRSADVKSDLEIFRSCVNKAGACLLARRTVCSDMKRRSLLPNRRRVYGKGKRQNNEMSVLGRCGRFIVIDTEHGLSIRDETRNTWYKKTGKGVAKDILIQLLRLYKMNSDVYIIPLSNLNWQNELTKTSSKRFLADQVEMKTIERDGGTGGAIRQCRIIADK